MRVSGFVAPDAETVQGINDRYALSVAERPSGRVS